VPGKIDYGSNTQHSAVSHHHRRRGHLAFTAEDAKVAKKNRAADFSDERRLGKQPTKDTKDRKEKGAAKKQSAISGQPK
jgi:hypothetical protein